LKRSPNNIGNYELEIPEEARLVKLPVPDKEKVLLKSNDPHNWFEIKAIAILILLFCVKHRP
jgi:hypothetical protein